MLQYAAACRKVVRAECPMVAEEFQGIAEGAAHLRAGEDSLAVATA
jgi:hypothetical protein